MRRGYGPGRGQQQISLPILLLGMQIMRAGFDRIPPVTLVSLMGQVAIFLRLLPFKLPSIQEACVSPVRYFFLSKGSNIVYIYGMIENRKFSRTICVMIVWQQREQLIEYICWIRYITTWHYQSLYDNNTSALHLVSQWYWRNQWFVHLISD